MSESGRNSGRSCAAAPASQIASRLLSPRHLDLHRGDAGAPHEIAEVAEQPARLARGDDALRDGRADPLHSGEPQPHREPPVAAVRGGFVGCVDVEGADRRLLPLGARVEPGRPFDLGR
jgi:hypothetical protein